MNLPQQFPYGPRLKTLLGFYAAGISFCAIPVHFRAFWFLIIIGLFFLFAALAGTFRRFVLQPCLAFSDDKLVLRRGRIPTEIPYSNIRGFQEARYGRMKVLKLLTKERLIEINSTLLPDIATFETIRDFLKMRVTPDTKPEPKIPGAYGLRCSYEGDGAIYDSNGELMRRFKTLHFGKPHYPYGVFRIPDFVMCDKAEKEIFRVKPMRRWMPLARFVMTRDGFPVCTIRLRSILRNKYTLEFTNGEKWGFHAPLFSINFGATSETGKSIRIRVKSHNVWFALLDPQHDRPELVCALAFLHRERLRFN